MEAGGERGSRSGCTASRVTVLQVAQQLSAVMQALHMVHSSVHALQVPPLIHPPPFECPCLALPPTTPYPPHYDAACVTLPPTSTSARTTRRRQAGAAASSGGTPTPRDLPLHTSPDDSRRGSFNARK